MATTRIRALGVLGAFFLLAFGALQFVRPRLTNPPVTADLDAPAEVKTILKTSCYNCHSNETQVPWFDRIVPAYWLVVRDVRHGREHMNFSHFGKLSPAQQKGFLYESVNQIQLGFMPPANYLLVHPGAKVTTQQLDVLKKYLHPSDEVTPASEEESAAANQQYESWLEQNAKPATTQTVAPTLNGLAFFPDYKNWKPVSTTHRFDNGTFRVILGNDVAQRAIAANNIHPWPDGAAFAKIAWKRKTDEAEAIWTGEFVQIEFMLKDAKKYASTEGWGFGRWRGTGFKPYGKTANFTVECTSCHRPMQANDYVYTMPIHDPGTASDAFNREAALPNSLPWSPLEWNVITTKVDHAHHTMSTLYGNPSAVDHVRTSPQSEFPTGAVLSMVTWDEREDRHWFGGLIPGKVRSVEFVNFAAGPDGKTAPAYESYEGSPLAKAAPVDATESQPRIDAIVNLRAAVMP